jgi:hypothetical protein
LRFAVTFRIMSGELQSECRRYLNHPRHTPGGTSHAKSAGRCASC